MAKSNYIKGPDDEFSAQLITFKNNIGAYNVILGVSAPVIAAQAADSDYFAFQLACQQIGLNLAQECTAWKDLIRKGGEPPGTGTPQIPAFPTPPAEVAPGVEPRFRALCKLLKAHANYNEAIGEALGIEGAEQAGPDLSTIKPVIDVTITGNHVFIEWGWQGNRGSLSMCEIQVDRGAGFVVLAYDTTPGYVDTQPFPATPAKWTYRAIYRVGDAQVGQWSQSASISVG